MNFQAYLTTVLKREKPFPREKRLQHAQVGMISELGELADLVKRAFVYGKEFDAVNLLEEVGDFIWYFTVWADAMQIHAGKLDKAHTHVAAGIASEDYDGFDPVEAVRALFCATAVLCAADPSESLNEGHYEAVANAIAVSCCLLKKYNFTLEQCFIVNDSKLELRNKGGKFDAHAILNRDVAAERLVLEAGAKQ